MSDRRDLIVEATISVDVDDVGELGAEHLHIILEAACAAAADSVARTHSGVRGWHVGRIMGLLTPEPEESP